VRVITNSLPVLHDRSDSEQAELIAIGGTFRRLTCSYVGPAAVAAVRAHFADRLFMSVTGVTAGGVVTEADVLEAEVKRSMLERSEQSVLLLDESKLSARGRQAIASVDAVSFVLAEGLRGEDAERLTRAGATVRPVRSIQKEENDHE
jgi:DeoR/GlpR family transcriptional regulator of sugar metabolism